jgi:hypothetical protein
MAIVIVSPGDTVLLGLYYDGELVRMDDPPAGEA